MLQVKQVNLHPAPPVDENTCESPEWVRISMASAIALRFRSGRFSREFPFGGINLLLQYADGCRSDCAYCGLARTRPGSYTQKSFIRVDWPLVRTDDLVERMARYEAKLTRLCISMVTHGRAYEDTCEITRKVREQVSTPLSVLVAPPTLTRARLERFKALGVDMIGVGLDAATEDLFRRLRTDVPAGGLRWRNYWQVIDWAREIFGPWKVNCHVLVGLGETDRDLIDLFLRLRDRQIYAYLFSFNPEPDSRMGLHPRAPLRRWRWIQLAKFLIETERFGWEHFRFDENGMLTTILGPEEGIQRAVVSGLPFVTNGCPGKQGELGCTRPYGSYRPSEPFRDYPLAPDAQDLREICTQMGIQLPRILNTAGAGSGEQDSAFLGTP